MTIEQTVNNKPTKKIEDPIALSLAQHIVSLQAELEDRIGVLSKDRDEKMAAIEEGFKSESVSVFDSISSEARETQANLYNALDIPEDEHGAWFIDARYLVEHGVAFIEYNPEEQKRRLQLQKNAEEKLGRASH